MAKFCGYCGSRLDIDTGLCPNCDKERLQQSQPEVREEVQEDQSERDNNVPRMRPAKAARNTPQSHSEFRPGRRGRALAVGLILLAVVFAGSGVAFLFLREQRSDNLSAEMITGDVAETDAEKAVVPEELYSQVDEGLTTDEADEAVPVVEEASDAMIPTQNTVLRASVGPDHKAYIDLLDRSCMVINGDVSSAAITADREHVVVLLTDGTLYVTDTGQSYRQTLAENALFVQDIKDDGVIYEGTDGLFYRVLFENESVFCIGNGNYNCAQNSVRSLIYMDDSDDIWMMSGEERTNIDHQFAIAAKDILDNGKVAIWTPADGDEWSAGTRVMEYGLCIYEDGNTTTLSEMDVFRAKWRYSMDQNMIVLWKAYDNEDADCGTHLWVKYPGGTLLPLAIDGVVDNVYVGQEVFTDQGYLANTMAEDVTTLYLCALDPELMQGTAATYLNSSDGDKAVSLYGVSLEGDSQRILENIKSYAIANHRIAYVDENQILYVANISNGVISETQQIATDVHYEDGYPECGLDLTENGVYLYYYTEDGILYCYRFGEECPIRIGPISTTSSRYNRYSDTGATVLFTNDEGTFCMWNYGDEEVAEIVENVVNASVSSGMNTNQGANAPYPYAREIVDPNSFVYRYVDPYGSGGETMYLMYYDGTDTYTLAENVY